jgi:hypothetical protein
MAPLKLPQGFQCRLFGSSASSLDLGEHVDESSMQLLPPMTPVEGEVASTACDGSGKAMIVLSSDNEGNTVLRLICLTYDSNALHFNEDVASSSAKKKRILEMRSRYDTNRQFQDHWATRLPWVEPELDSDGVLVAVKCIVCSVVNGKPKLIVPKWGNLEKHIGKRRALLDLPKKGLKKGQTYWETNNKHVKNMALFVSRKPQSVLELVHNTVVGENRQKLVQFSTLFHVLKRGCPMVEFEQLWELLQHLQMRHMPHKYWSDVNGWEMAHHLHLQVL